MLDHALDFLDAAAPADLPTAVLAEPLRALERAESRHTAARARLLASFMARSGCETDGQGSARAWLVWQTSVTKAAAAGAVGWARRLAAHPVIGRALTAVLAALGKKAGAEDTRTAGQRRHDALEEACRRLLGAAMVPGGAGQPVPALVHLTLRELRDLPGASAAEEAWFAARAGQPGWLTGSEAKAAACDASVAPVVTGHVDPAALDRLTTVVLALHAGECGCTCGGCPCRPTQADSRQHAHAPGLREKLLRAAADVLSGPGGLAAWLRSSQLSGPLAGPALPLDVPLPLDAGQAQVTIPAHLRRAVVTRHRTCAFPGCAHPAARCHLHHLIPRARGGPTTLANLVPLCPFHHLTAIHRWGWTLTLHPDGTTTATSPDRNRTIRSHGPPGQAA